MPKLSPINTCTGCTACMNVCPRQCIEMKKDKYGFSYPEIACSADCINCGRCENACPALKNEIISEKLPSAYAALSKNEPLRMDSSSGGISSELAKYIIEQGGVVFGAAYDEHFNVAHCCVDRIEDLHKLRGAKYAESDLGDSFAEVIFRLQNGQKVLFSGTPCQVAGLKAITGDQYSNLYCVDFVCHGVPSPMAWQEYIKYRANNDADGVYPISINLRSKHTGWSRYQYSNLFEYENGGKHSEISSESLFMKIFVGDYISRESCENCKFKGYSRVSDITLGDFWGIWDIDPQLDDNKGTSVILVQSEKGQALWNGISERIIYRQVTLEQASRQNPSMLRPSLSNSQRNDVLNKIREGKFKECEMLFVPPKPTVSDRIKGKIKRVLHMK